MKKKPDHITNDDFNKLLPQILYKYSLYLGQKEEESYENIYQFFKKVNDNYEESIQQRQNDETTA